MCVHNNTNKWSNQNVLTQDDPTVHVNDAIRTSKLSSITDNTKSRLVGYHLFCFICVEIQEAIKRNGCTKRCKMCQVVTWKYVIPRSLNRLFDHQESTATLAALWGFNAHCETKIKLLITKALDELNVDLMMGLNKKSENHHSYLA